MAKIHLLSGNNVVATVELTGDLVTIGRTEDKNLCIEDDSISKDHGILVRAGEDYQIHDFNSTNGTWVNGERVLAVKLKHGDRLRIGHVDVLYDSAAAPPAPKIKLGEGAKRIEHPPVVLPVAPVVAAPSPAQPPPPAPPAPAPVAVVEPPKPVRRTLGGKSLGAPREPAMAVEPPKKASQPVAPKKSEDRVFINIPESPSAPAPKKPAPVLNRPSAPVVSAAPLPPPPPPPPEPPVLEAVPLAAEDLSEYEVIPQIEEPAAEEAPVVEMPLSADPEAPAVEKKLQVGAGGAGKGEVKLRPAAPTGGSEKKLSFKPAAQAPRDQLRFGPAKKS